MKVVVLAGGLSPEREVSLCSGSLIANALMQKGHRVLLLDVYTGLSELPADLDGLFVTDRTYRHDISPEVPELEALKAATGNGDALIGKNVLKLCRAADCVFLALHGGMGENGQLQATLDTHGIRYTGSGYLGCSLAMDKEISKRLFCTAGIPTPEWMYFDTETDSIDTLLDTVGLPCVVKPCGCGSSVGVSMADTRSELSAALADAAKWGSCVLVEKKIVGRELTVGILDGVALPPVEILPAEGFYDYQNKYRGNTRELCPAPLPPELTQRMAELAQRGFEVLRLEGYARLDFLLDAAGELWCLEANSLPGMTPASLLPQEAAAAGISYPDLCERILSLALRQR